MQKQKLKNKENYKLVVFTRKLYKLDLKKELAVLFVLWGLSIGGRIALQNIPSVEPIVALSSLVGFIFGPFKGFIFGASSFYTSNFFVWGGQGIWSLFQSLGAGFAGLIGGLIGKIKKRRRFTFLLSSFLSSVLYEIIVTIPVGFIFSKSILFYMLTSIPFSVVHILSTLGFSFVLFEFREKIDKKRWLVYGKEIFGFRVNLDNSSEYNNGLEHTIDKVFYIRKTENSNDDRFWIVEKGKGD